ncbi:MAG: hypothetical protein MMC33_006294 [Icmadophila ericetorum]|nr:hypothetical protein [Icmadophila ericetorum]
MVNAADGVVLDTLIDNGVSLHELFDQGSNYLGSRKMALVYRGRSDQRTPGQTFERLAGTLVSIGIRSGCILIEPSWNGCDNRML